MIIYTKTYIHTCHERERFREREKEIYRVVAWWCEFWFCFQRLDLQVSNLQLLLITHLAYSFYFILYILFSGEPKTN